MPKMRAGIIYSGTVHGVGFRFTAERIAISLGLTGWVQNCLNGTVEVLCEGGEPDIKMLMDKINKAMSTYIRSSKITWKDATGEFSSFGIKF